MSAFTPLERAFRGEVLINGDAAEIFPMFSPTGERLWAPGWDPDLLHPKGIDWAHGQIFRTREKSGEVVWIVTRLDRAAHSVEYHRVEPGLYVARITVECRPADRHTTKAVVAYSYIGLSEAGNREIEAMTQPDYDAKMTRWTGWINEAVAKRGRERPA